MIKLDNHKTLHKLSVALFCAYLLLLVWVISLKCNMKVTITDTYYIFGAMTWPEKLQFAKQSFLALFTQNDWANVFLDARQDLLNIVIFVPFGLYVAFFAKKCRLLWAVVLSLLTSFVLESLQLISHIGCFAAIDLVTNTLGGLVGWGVYKLLYKNKPKTIKTLCICSIVGLIVAVPLVCYAVVKTATMFDFYLDILLRRY